MSKFLKAMSKIGLVELSDDEQVQVEKSSEKELSMEEIDAILASEAKAAPQAAPSAPAPSTPQAAAPQATPSGSSPSVLEDEPFEKIYAAAGTPSVAYPAEKLLKVLDGLKAMDPPMRKAAVVAMDSADDAWTVADAVLDAERKIQALNSRKQNLIATVEGMASEAAAEKERREQYLAQATQTIRDKIAELETTLQEEAAQIASQKAEIDSKLAAARAALTREQTRLDTEAGRLREIPQIFAVSRPQQ